MAPRIVRSPPFVGLCIAVTGISLVLGACSAEPPSSATQDPYWNEYEQAIADATSDFIRSVLADHKVTEQEMAESQDSQLACLRDQGFEPALTTENGRRLVHVPAEAGPTCYDEWVGDIEALYVAERVNPRNEDMYDLVAACFVRVGLAPTGFDGRDLEELDAQAVGSYTITEDGERIDEVLPANANPTLPSGMSIRAEETLPCWSSPVTAGL